MKSFYIFFFIYLSSNLGTILHAFPNDDLETLKIELRQTLNDREIYTQQKKEQIEKLESEYVSAKDDEHRYEILCKLIHECYKFDARLTEKYINNARDLSIINHRKDWYYENSIILAELQAATGLMTESQKELFQIPIQELTGDIKTHYYLTLAYYYSHLSELQSLESETYQQYRQQAVIAADSAYANCPNPSNPLYWYNFNFLIDKYATNPEWLIAHIDSLDKNDLIYPQVLTTLSVILRKREDRQWVKYDIISSIADIKLANQDIPALVALSNYFLSEEDLDMSYACINYCYTNSEYYSARIRQASFSPVLNKIHYSYVQRSEKEKKISNRLFIGIVILLLIILVTLALLYHQASKLRNMNALLKEADLLKEKHIRELSNMNLDIIALNKKLSTINKELQESNKIKELYIGDIFGICSNYINRLEKFRQNIFRKLKANQIKEAINIADSNYNAFPNEMQNFNEMFDSIILHLRPSFVSDFNKLLRPEEQIVPKNGSLTLELRIYALFNMGITESNKIALFLHYSVQTIYNTRLKVRNKSIFPKELFLERVSAIGKTDNIVP